VRERAENKGFQRERRQNEGGGNEAPRRQKVRGACLWGLAPETAEARKTVENRPVHRKNWVRTRQVGPPRKSADIGGMFALSDELNGEAEPAFDFWCRTDKSHTTNMYSCLYMYMHMSWS